jgi:hypothetical protein
MITLFQYYKNKCVFIFILDIMMFSGLRSTSTREKVWMLMSLLHDLVIAAF